MGNLSHFKACALSLRSYPFSRVTCPCSTHFLPNLEPCLLGAALGVLSVFTQGTWCRTETHTGFASGESPWGMKGISGTKGHPQSPFLILYVEATSQPSQQAFPKASGHIYTPLKTQ